MKTVTFEGQQYELKNWANYIARDKDGSVFQFELDPTIKFGHSWFTDGGKYFRVQPIDQKDWRESKVKV